MDSVKYQAGLAILANSGWEKTQNEGEFIKDGISLFYDLLEEGRKESYLLMFMGHDKVKTIIYDYLPEKIESPI